MRRREDKGKESKIKGGYRKQNEVRELQEIAEKMMIDMASKL